VHTFSTDRPEVPIRETEAKHVFDILDTSKDESIHFRRKRGKDNGAVDDGMVADNGVVIDVGPVIAVFGLCLLVML